MRRINYKLDENDFVIEWHDVPFDENSPYLELDNNINITIGLDKVVDGILILATERKAALKRIEELKRFLAESDYMCLKYIDGALTEEEYSSVRAQRAAWRAEINELEEN